ncbi:MAG: ribosome-associated translation inhibitor RaiA [Clostridia bacterium]|nr:ribosome-associated translation inhibitor RaiA [Clostridia bacterium]
MNISVIGRHLNVRDDTKALIEKKLAKFDKFFPSGADATVTCKSEGDEKRMEITISVGGTLFRAEEASSTFQNALDGCMSSIERQIRKNKTRLEKKMRSSIAVPVADGPDEPAEEELLFDVRTKTFPLKPMTTDEAILQMNLLGHSFYLFCDSQTEETCAVYKRRDGA